MTNTTSHGRRTYPGLLARGAAKLAPRHGLRTRWVHHIVMGQGPLRHPIHRSKASIWHPSTLLREGQRLQENNTLRLLGDKVSLPHHLGHYTIPFCTATCAAKSPEWRQVVKPSSLPLATVYKGQSGSFQSILRALHMHQSQPHLAGRPLWRGGYNSCINSPSPTPLVSP